VEEISGDKIERYLKSANLTPRMLWDKTCLDITYSTNGCLIVHAKADHADQIGDVIQLGYLEDPGSFEPAYDAVLMNELHMVREFDYSMKSLDMNRVKASREKELYMQRENKHRRGLMRMYRAEVNRKKLVKQALNN
jgi:hypothetical protein